MGLKMFMFSLLKLLLLVIKCSGSAEFVQFPGFDAIPASVSQIYSTVNYTSISEDTSVTTIHSLTTETPSNSKLTTSVTNTTFLHTLTPNNITKKIIYKCPEEETPRNIGAYEIPSQRDLVLLTKNILLSLFNSYNQQSMQLLKDIKEVTKVALKMVSKCRFNKKMYVQCVKIASKQCERYTKDSLLNLEAQKLDVLALTQDKICSLSDMKANPLLLIRLLAQEKSTLEFALPGVLLLIDSCNVHCSRPKGMPANKPVRHITDQDLVIRHFLTKKSYIQLINDSKHKV